MLVKRENACVTFDLPRPGRPATWLACLPWQICYALCDAPHSSYGI